VLRAENTLTADGKAPSLGGLGLEQINFETLTPALNGANELRLRLRGGKPCYRMPCLEQFQSEIALVQCNA
jgi:hypothetical protein